MNHTEPDTKHKDKVIQKMKFKPGSQIKVFYNNATPEESKFKNTVYIGLLSLRGIEFQITPHFHQK